MGLFDYSATRDLNADIVPGNIRTKVKEQQQIINAIRQMMADLAALNGGASGVIGVNGIKFPATQVDSADANTLDDYQQESWTPVWLSGAGAFGAITYDATRAGAATKIGNAVIFTFRMLTDTLAVGTASGQIRIGGLPYSAAGVSGISIGFVTNFAVNLPWYGLVSGTDIFMYHKTAITANSAATVVTDMVAGASADANFIQGGGVYRV